MARRRRRPGKLADFEPVCTAQIFVGGGVGRYSKPGQRVVVDPERLSRRVQEIVSARFAGSTHVKARGFWEGVGEPSVVVSVMQPGGGQCPAFFERARCAAGDIARTLQQDAVAVLGRDADGKSRVDFVTKERGSARCNLSPGEAREAKRRIDAIRKLT